MEDFGQIFIVLVFILVTFLEAVGRKRKAGRKGGPRPQEAEEPVSAPPPPREVAGPRPAPGTGSRGEEEKDSEGLIPKEVWEEILGLARGPRTAGPPPAPPRPEEEERSWGEDPGLTRRRRETLEEVPDFEARSLEPLTPRGSEAGTSAPPRGSTTLPPVHRGSVGATKPIAAMTPIRSRAVGRGPEAADLAGVGSGSRPGRARARLFGSGSPEELRKAVILREVLGPPLALRDEVQDREPGR